MKHSAGGNSLPVRLGDLLELLLRTDLALAFGVEGGVAGGLGAGSAGLVTADF